MKYCGKVWPLDFRISMRNNVPNRCFSSYACNGRAHTVVHLKEIQGEAKEKKDKKRAHWLPRDLWEANLESVLEGEKLHGHYGEDLNVDAVEFVKTSPGAALCQAGKKAAHEAKVEGFSRVEDDAIHAQGPAQVLDCFRLTSPCRPWTSEPHLPALEARD